MIPIERGRHSPLIVNDDRFGRDLKEKQREQREAHAAFYGSRWPATEPHTPFRDCFCNQLSRFETKNKRNKTEYGPIVAVRRWESPASCGICLAV
jgi:hypothetical protein